MTGREDGTGRTLRTLLLEETNAMPVDTHHAAVHLRRRLADTRKRRRVTLAVAASVVAAVAVTLAGGWLGGNKAGDPAHNPDQSVGVARKFLDAVGRYDADGAVSYLTNDAVVQGNTIAYTGSDAAEQLRLTLAHFRAAGYKQTINDCAQVGNSASGVIVSCAFDLQAIRSDEIGLGPYTDNVWRLTVRDGKIVSAQQEMPHSSNGFSTQVWAPFAAWVSIRHPDDVLTMYINYDDMSTIGTQRFAEDSNRLWERRSAEYVAAVNRDPATQLDQPKVAAYVAKLDSICAAAQAEVNKEIKANPQQNQPAIIAARERVMRETMAELDAAPLPKAVYWPYKGRAFPLLEKFYAYPHNVQPPESLARQIQQIPGLDKCIFPV
jgi:hypothetical protein